MKSLDGRKKNDPDEDLAREPAGEILAVVFRRALRSVGKEEEVGGGVRFLNRGITRKRVACRVRRSCDSSLVFII